MRAPPPSGSLRLGCWSLVACAKTPAAAHAGRGRGRQAARRRGAAERHDAAARHRAVSKLDDFGKKVFFRVANSEPSVCGQAQSLIHSAKKALPALGQRRCATSAKLVEQGFTDSEIVGEAGQALPPGQPKKIDVADAPMKGNPSAKITLVEFADYECPHCKRFQPVLRQILDEFHSDVKLYFKHYPLPQHTNARLAAEAAVAAQKQGKFWQFQDKLWDKQDELSPAEIEKTAKESGPRRREVPPGPGVGGGQGARPEGSRRRRGGRHPGDARPSTSTAASTPTAATPRACANGSRTQ